MIYIGDVFEISTKNSAWKLCHLVNVCGQFGNPWFIGVVGNKNIECLHCNIVSLQRYYEQRYN